MSENTISSETGKSFFGSYFRYKLRTLRGMTITFAVMNFLSTTCFSAVVLAIVNTLILPTIDGTFDMENMKLVSLYLMIMYLMAVIMIVEMIMLVILPALNFKYFNRRSHMDTLGGLPLTAKQRFFGDMLSGAASFGLSFVPCSVIAAVIAVITEFGPMQQLYNSAGSEQNYYRYVSSFPWGDENILKVVLIVLLTLLVCYAATYAISCFVTSCCGKLGTSILFSFIMILAFTLITYLFCNYTVSSAVGYDAEAANLTMLSAIPPAGTFITTIAALTTSDMAFAVLTPLMPVILLFIAAFTAGAYFAAIHRKTERVDREISFDAGYYVISALITLIAGGFTVYMLDNGPAPYTFPTIIIAFVTCIVMAFLRRRSVKDIWKGAVVFAAAGAACIGIGFVIRSTHGLGISYSIPSKRSIESIEISGQTIHMKFQGSQDFEGSVTVKSENGIDLVLSEHQKIIDDLDNYTSEIINGGCYPLTIKYHLKSGLTQTRLYVYTGKTESIDDDPAVKFADTISGLPELNFMTTLGILGNPDMPCVNITYFENGIAENTGRLIIKPSEREKFIECFREDLMDSPRIPAQTDTDPGLIMYEYIDKSGRRRTLYYSLLSSHKNTVKFLEDPDNFSVGTEITVDTSESFYVTFNDDLTDNMISFDLTHPGLASEFLSYAEAALEIDDEIYSERFRIISSDGYSFRIRKENEQAALSAYIKAIRAKFVASDIPAVLEYTRDFYFLADGEFVELARDEISFYDEELNKIDKKIERVEWSEKASSKEGYEDYML